MIKQYAFKKTLPGVNIDALTPQTFTGNGMPITRAKIKGKGVTKRKQAALWGKYCPIQPESPFPISVNDGSYGTVSGDRYVAVEWED